MPREILRCALLVAALLAPTAGCSPVRVAELFLLGDRFVRTANLAYGDAARQRLDVYRPRGGGGGGGGGGAPVVVFLYGGRWQRGSREEYRLLGDALTRRGAVAVVPDYRLYPEVRFPVWAEDAARAIRWTHDSIRRFGGDPARIVVVGHSAGAHTAVLLALDPHYLRDAGVPAGSVRGFVGLAGPVATTWTDPDVRALMGPPAGWARTYPMEQPVVSGVPILLLHGGRDKVVRPANSLRLAARLRAHGGCARAIVYPGLEHVTILVALAAPRLGIAGVMDAVMAFVRAAAAGVCPFPPPLKPRRAASMPSPSRSPAR